MKSKVKSQICILLMPLSMMVSGCGAQEVADTGIQEVQKTLVWKAKNGEGSCSLGKCNRDAKYQLTYDTSKWRGWAGVSKVDLYDMQFMRVGTGQKVYVKFYGNAEPQSDRSHQSLEYSFKKYALDKDDELLTSTEKVINDISFHLFEKHNQATDDYVRRYDTYGPYGHGRIVCVSLGQDFSEYESDIAELLEGFSFYQGKIEDKSKIKGFFRSLADSAEHIEYRDWSGEDLERQWLD